MEEQQEVSHPLLSCFITLYTLILLYFPHELLLSPVLLLSCVLLLSLSHLGSTRQSNTRPGIVDLEVSVPDTSETKLELVEWNLRAPLEVIHEAYEDDDDEEQEEEDPTSRLKEIERLSLCYPESDSDSSSEFDFPEVGNWNSEEDDGVGLIEIKLDECHHHYKKWNQTEFDFHSEEDGLIEIDLFP